MPSNHDDSDEDSISGQSSALDASSTSPSAKTAGSSEDQDKEKLVQKETIYVFYLRMAVMAVLLCAATAVSLVVHHITKTAEVDSMESHFDAEADMVTGAFMHIAHEKMGTAGSLVVAATAAGLSLGRQWPFVTLTAFQERAATIKQLSGALYIGFNPIVVHQQREEWEIYSNDHDDAAWYNEGREYQEKLGIDQLDNRPQVETDDPDLVLDSGIANHIYDYVRDDTEMGGHQPGKGFVSPQSQHYLPIWQTSPVTARCMVNQNRESNSDGAVQALLNDEVVFEKMERSDPGYGDDNNPRTAEIAWLLRMANRGRTKYDGDVFSSVYFPVHSDFSVNRTVVGEMRIVIHWARFFTNILPNSSRGIIVVLENFCDEPYTYKVDGASVTPLGNGDLHDSKYDRHKKSATFRDVDTIADGTIHGMTVNQHDCPYAIRVYPSEEFENLYLTNTPLLITFAVACVFLFTVAMFYCYDFLVERRQRILMHKAKQTHQIVASLFPKNVRDRLLDTANDTNKNSGGLLPANHRLRTFLNGQDDENRTGQAPIADLFPHCTVLFADIAGFTAWSSTREPAQVFVLLQSLYQAFDRIAKQRKVFKVETIGDSYVAVTGCPEPQVNHAVIMSRFSAECMMKMTEITRELEKSLGPETGELSMRFGMNSGPVTAGVLRGERSRFQLFGDTMNTASRMESTGVPGKIQASQTTADILRKSGKGHWVRPRDDNVIAKGKGVLQTYWITPHVKKGTSHASSETGSSDNNLESTAPEPMDVKTVALLKHERQIDWVVELLLDCIRKIVAHRDAKKSVATSCTSCSLEAKHHRPGQIALDEVVEAIKLPDFDAKTIHADASVVSVSSDVVTCLREYVSIIASTYRDNPFHNFEHACHVTLSASKFLSRIVTPDLDLSDMGCSTTGGGTDDNNTMKKKIAVHLHDYTHGINSDPITLFAILFSAIVHDVDHRGISNQQLMKEEPLMAVMFQNKSIAEQNSLEIAWELLVSDRFRLLLDYIFVDDNDLCRFRQIVVNVVLATDIFDKELNDLRKLRWEKAFREEKNKTVASRLARSRCHDETSLRATIVLEHIMQASDVCHTMQHWHIYRKWNQRLFFEMMLAHKNGRMMNNFNPSASWYNSELGFFDNYIIPLAKKLKDCNVFGVSSDECLNFALRNRQEWEARGEEIVEEMLEEFHTTVGNVPTKVDDVVVVV